MTQNVGLGKGAPFRIFRATNISRAVPTRGEPRGQNRSTDELTIRTVQAILPTLLLLLRATKVALEQLRICACCGRGSEKHGRARDENADGVCQLEGARRILLDQDDGQSAP